MSEPIDYQKLKLDRVINESKLTKSITFQGTYNGQPAVIRLDKTPFDKQSAMEALNHKGLEPTLSLANDIYSRYKLRPPVGDVNDIQAIVVTPANEAVLAKYSQSETVIFPETSQVYDKIVEPFIHHMLTTDKDYNQWIYNILAGKSESENVIMDDKHPDTGFMLIPSLKSSGDEKDLHVLAICHRRDIRSLRDLNDQHLPLLNNILDNGTKAITDKYRLARGQLRSYIHYHPTFYYFHVHFETINPSEYKASDRDNLLTTVISNISLVSDYYKRATLTYPLPKSWALYEELKKNDLL